MQIELFGVFKAVEPIQYPISRANFLGRQMKWTLPVRNQSVNSPKVFCADGGASARRLLHWSSHATLGFPRIRTRAGFWSFVKKFYMVPFTVPARSVTPKNHYKDISIRGEQKLGEAGHHQLKRGGARARRGTEETTSQKEETSSYYYSQQRK